MKSYKPLPFFSSLVNRMSFPYDSLDTVHLGVVYAQSADAMPTPLRRLEMKLKHRVGPDVSNAQESRNERSLGSNV